MKKDEQEIVIINKQDLTFEESVERIKKINDIFVDIAVQYHVDKMKEKGTQ